MEGSCSPLLCLSPALADFDEPQRSTFTMFGVLTIAVRTYHDHWGYGVYSGPIGTATLIIAVKWVSTSGISADRAQGTCICPLIFVSLISPHPYVQVN